MKHSEVMQTAVACYMLQGLIDDVDDAVTMAITDR